jgi:uncharacterized protein (DUF488 family)
MSAAVQMVLPIPEVLWQHGKWYSGTKNEYPSMKLFTIGYGGRAPADFISLLKNGNVRTLVDIRLRPDRASMGIWVKAKTPDKGIERILSDAGIDYRSLVELGNIFREREDWQQDYEQLLATSGELLVSRLAGIEGPICLMCAEKRVAECHRRHVAEYLARTQGFEIVHLE